MGNACERRRQLLHESMEAPSTCCLRIICAPQVKAVHDAAALVCVHGADCMNLMFLPPRGAVVEIDPVHYGASWSR